MIYTYLKRFEWLVILVLLQVLVLNNVHISGYATPFLYIYFILSLNTGLSRNALLLWGFVLGLLIDIFSNTFGMHAAATVLLAFIRPIIMNLYISRESLDDVEPSFASLGMGPFIKYVITCVFIHHIALLSIEAFSFLNPLDLVLKILTSSILTILFILALEGIRR